MEAADVPGPMGRSVEDGTGRRGRNGPGQLERTNQKNKCICSLVRLFAGCWASCANCEGAARTKFSSFFSIFNKLRIN